MKKYDGIISFDEGKVGAFHGYKSCSTILNLIYADDLQTYFNGS